MDPCPFLRLTLAYLALKIPVASKPACSLLSVSLVLVLLCLHITARPSMADRRIVQIGVILDLNSILGKMLNNSLAFAVDDYYSENKDTATKINLTVLDVPQNDVVAAAGAAGILILDNKVRAILGPQNSEQARYVVKRGARSREENQVPVIWFPITGPSLLPPPSPSSIYSDEGLNCFQFRAIADIIKDLGWQSIVPIYEKTEFGSHLLPCLTNVLKDMGIQMANVTAIDSSSTDLGINTTLDTLKNMRTHVFLVHMSMDLGTTFILAARGRKMMDEGYAWILTQELSSLTDPQHKITRELYNADLSSFITNVDDRVPLTIYMQGALGVRPRDPERTKTRREKETNFSKRFNSWLTIYGWWAYHTIEALAMALEKPGSTDSGLTLRSQILDTNFTAKSGVHFDLTKGQLDQSELEVYNVVGYCERIIGNWSPGRGLFQNQSSNKGGETAGEYKVKDPLWPGYTLDKPPKLRIGVPTKNSSPELVNADNSSERLTIDGFAKNVFLKALDVFPFRLNNYEFVALPNMTYDDILCSQMKEKDLDAIIGDITILANRTNCVDFTFPYLDSSVAMVVRVKDASTNKLILVKPFNGLLWLLFCLIFVVATTTIILFLQINETRNRTNQTGGGDETGGGNGTSQPGGGNGTSQTGGRNGTSQTGAGSGASQTGAGNGASQTGGGNRNNQTDGEYRFNPFLVYKMYVMEINSTSKAAGWMVILTSFLFIFIVQVYTASLTSILTKGKTKEPLFMDENGLKSSNLSVGYQNGSWVRGLLIEQIGFNPSQLKGLGSHEEYDEELSRGTQNGGVDAIFDETPYLMLFLSQYKPRFMMTGPIYQTGGFSFAFPKKSNLASHFSNAILDVADDVETYRVLMAKSSLPTSIEDSQLQDQKSDKFEL